MIDFSNAAEQITHSMLMISCRNSKNGEPAPVNGEPQGHLSYIGRTTPHFLAGTEGQGSHSGLVLRVREGRGAAEGYPGPSPLQCGGLRQGQKTADSGHEVWDRLQGDTQAKSVD